MLKRYKFDFIVILGIIALGVTLVILWFILAKNEKGHKAKFYRDSVEIKEIDLSINNTYIVEGVISEIKIKVENGFIDVIESGCKNQVCVNHHEICNIGSSIICLPNKVEIRIEE